MGLFSWNTQDTNRSIPCTGSERQTFAVTMIDDQGNRWDEENYEGYGVFGGKDYYELLEEMNARAEGRSSQGSTDEKRSSGILRRYESGGKPDISPNLIEEPADWTFDPNGPNVCEFQGFFYDDNSIDVDEWWCSEE